MNCELVFDLAGAVRAAGRLDVDLALAEGADLGGGFRGRFLFLLLQALRLVGGLHDREQDQRGQQELNDHRGKLDQRSGPGRSAGFNRGQARDDRVQEDLHHSGDDLTEGSAQNDGDRQIQDVTLHCKLFELFQQFLHDRLPLPDILLWITISH